MWRCVHLHHGVSQLIEIIPVWHVLPPTVAVDPVQALPEVEEVQEALMMPHNTEVVEGKTANPCMEDFMEDASMANFTSPYRIKFLSHLHSDVSNAAYLEGLRLATIGHHVDDALKTMKPMMSKCPLASLAIPLLMICRGHYYMAMEEISHFWRCTSDLKIVEATGCEIIKQ